MSVDDIRIAKGLALLDFHEAKQELAELEREMRRLASEFQKFGKLFEQDPFNIADTFGTSILNSQQAIDLARRAQDVTRRREKASGQMRQFGITED